MKRAQKANQVTAHQHVARNVETRLSASAVDLTSSYIRTRYYAPTMAVQMCGSSSRAIDLRQIKMRWAQQQQKQRRMESGREEGRKKEEEEDGEQNHCRPKFSAVNYVTLGIDMGIIIP